MYNVKYYCTTIYNTNLYSKLLYNNILTISKYQKGYIGDLIKRAGNFYLPIFFHLE